MRHISNFTDFDTLERDPRVNLFYTNNVTDLQRGDIIILPGTKATLDDLLELRRNGCAQAIQRAHRDGKTVVGICGGYQMLGQTVSNPDQPILQTDHCIGTYIHGFLDNMPVIEHLLKANGQKPAANNLSYSDFKEQQYDKLAEHVRKYVDIPRLYQILSA